jgi:Carboxypeptidase regulatory-like domain
VKRILHLVAPCLFALCMRAQVPAYNVSGTTEEVNGIPMGSANLALFSGAAVFQTSSDPSGKFTFKNVPAGQYELQAMAAGTKRATQDLRVAEASIDDLDVTLSFVMSEPSPLQALPAYEPLADPTLSKLTGTIRISRKKPLSRASVTLVNQSTRERAVCRTDRKGNFATSSLTPGRYTLTASHPGYTPAVIFDIWAVAGRSAYVAIQLYVVGAMFQ